MEVLEKINFNGYLKELQDCPNPEERREKLIELFPETKNWLRIAKVQLLVILQKDLGIFLEVCQFLNTDGHRQYCEKTGHECPCGIPQKTCVIRDGEIET